MRYFLTLLITMATLTASPGFAQQTPAVPATPAPAPADIIVKRTGDEIAARVEEVGTELVKYRRADNLQGPLFSILKSEVFMIRYANGTRDVFAAPRPVAGPATPPPTTLPSTSADSVFAPVRAAGPRIGLTIIGPGRLRNRLREDFNATNVISQFGWQFETRLFALPSGLSGLVEFVPLIGGLEQGLFLPSISGLLGLRGRKGFEIGVGPNLSIAGAGLVFAAGATIPGKYVNLPINVAYTPGSHQGNRFSLLLGYTYRPR